LSAKSSKFPTCHNISVGEPPNLAGFPWVFCGCPRCAGAFEGPADPSSVARVAAGGAGSSATAAALGSGGGDRGAQKMYMSLYVYIYIIYIYICM